MVNSKQQLLDAIRAKHPKYFAEGGATAATDQEEETPDPNEEWSKAPEAPSPETPEPEDADAAPEATPPAGAIPPKPDHMAPQPEIVVKGERKADYSGTGDTSKLGLNLAAMKPPVPTVDQLNNDDHLFAQDIQRGHITPETYADLFEKKSTLGKVSTMFGLLLGGMGGGLTHQPNAALEMMNGEIKRDLEAQIHSNTNSQNWAKLSMQHELQKVQIPLVAAQTEYEKAKTTQMPELTKQIQAHVNSLNEEAKFKATQSAHNKMEIAAAFGTYQDIVNKMPDGPQKQQAQQLLDTTIKPAVLSSVAQRNAQTAGMLGLQAATAAKNQAAAPQAAPQAAPAQQEDTRNANIDYDKLMKLRQQGIVTKGLSGIRPEDVHTAQTQAGEVDSNRALAKMYLDSFAKLTKFGAHLTPGLYNTETAALAAATARATAGRYNGTEAAAQASASFPSLQDFLTGASVVPEKLRKTMQHFQANEAGYSLLKDNGLVKPWPKELTPPVAKTKGQPAFKEGQKGTYQGESYTVKNGKRVFD